jgi:hypothetical protein
MLSADFASFAVQSDSELACRPPNPSHFVAKNVFLRSLWETLPIIQRLRVGTSLTIVWKIDNRSQAGVNLGNLDWRGSFWIAPVAPCL